MQREDYVSLIAACFEENANDYMIINENGVIDGAGHRFINLLGSKIVGLHISLLSDKEQ